MCYLHLIQYQDRQSKFYQFNLNYSKHHQQFQKIVKPLSKRKSMAFQILSSYLVHLLLISQKHRFQQMNIQLNFLKIQPKLYQQKELIQIRLDDKRLSREIQKLVHVTPNLMLLTETIDQFKLNYPTNHQLNKKL